ncbi:MAG: hypothetical protein AB1847_19505, partial [bacterium]
MGSMNSEKILVTRKIPGSYVNGHFVEGKDRYYTVKADIQPLSGKEILQLAEADRIRESLKIFTTFELEFGDTVKRGQKNYEIQKIADFFFSRVPHYEAIAVL